MTNFLSRLLELTTRIQQIPAPTFHEEERAMFVQAAFLAEGLEEVEIDAAGNVHACLKPGKDHPAGNAQPVIVSAHLDTVFPEGTDLTLHNEEGKVFGPGVGDNSLGVAGLFGLVWLLRERKVELPFTLHLVANTGEEGLGDLRGMKAIVERFGEDAQAYVILEGMALGHVYHRGLGVRRFLIKVRTEGGHSWIDYGHPSAIHELTHLSTWLTRLEMSNSPRTTLNIGVISGGTSVNTIAAEASLELDLRSESTEALRQLVTNMETVCQQGRKNGVEVMVEGIGERPAGEIPATHPLVSLAAGCLRALRLEPKLSIGSTDANIPLSRGLPAVTLCLTTGGRAHTVHEYINTAPLETGMEAVLGVVKGLG